MTDRDAKHPTGPLPRDAKGKLILDTSDPKVKAVYETAKRAKEEVASWPAWKRGEDEPITLTSCGMTFTVTDPTAIEKIRKAFEPVSVGYRVLDTETMKLESDFDLLTDICYREHPAFPLFKEEMKGKEYGAEALNDAWYFFKTGWEATVVTVTRSKYAAYVSLTQKDLEPGRYTYEVFPKSTEACPVILDFKHGQLVGIEVLSKTYLPDDLIAVAEDLDK